MGFSTLDKIEVRIKHITENLPEYHDQLIFSLEYIDKDPQSSLTKSRIVLEKTLNRIYQLHFDKEPKKLEIGFILNDNQFTRFIDRRILSRMNSVRDMANLGAHGEEVQPTDAKRVLDDLCEILNWFIQDHLRKEDKSKPQKTAGDKAQKKERKNSNPLIDKELNSADEYFRKGDFSNASKSANEAIRLLECGEGKNNYRYLAALNILGCCLISEKQHRQSLEKYSECLNTIEGFSKRETKYYSVIYNNLIIASLCGNQTPQALIFIEKYLELSSAVDDDTSRIMIKIKDKLT